VLFRWALKTVKYFRALKFSSRGHRFTIQDRTQCPHTHLESHLIFDDYTFGENWSVERTLKGHTRACTCVLSPCGLRTRQDFLGLVTALSTLATHRAASTSTNNGKLLVLSSTQEFLPSQA
jgi:hypothetical protein